MKTYEKVIAGIALVVILVFVIGASEKEEEKMITIPIETESLSTSKFENDFMEGCMGEDSTSYAMCSCAYNSIHNELGDDGIVELSVNYLKTEQIPEKVMTKVIKDCYGK